jgi:CRISPR-associated protein Cas1
MTADRNATETPDAEDDDATVVTGQDVADGLEAIERTFGDSSTDETLIVDGYGITVRISRGELELGDGIGTTRRTRRLSRAEAAAGRLRRVLVLGDGMVTTDAFAWCHSLGVALVIAGRFGEPLAVSAPELYGHGGLRRAQALSPFTETAMAITLALLDLRLADQARITRDLLGRIDRADGITELRGELGDVAKSTDAMIVEMRAAEHYWSAWTDELRLRFVAKDRRRVPERWTRFGGRSSPLNEAPGNRHAASPANALLNYGYRLAEIEAAISCRALGLDPALGLAHADGVNRPAFVLDLIEAARGLVEETVWQLSVSRVFRRADFAELGSGEIRVLAPLSHELARALLPSLRDVLAPAAEQIAAMLATIAPGDVTVPTTLTRSRHKTARAVRGDQARSQRTAPQPATRLWACPDCGAPVTDPRRVRCESCVAADPRQTAEHRGKRGRAIAARRKAQASWEAAGGGGDFDPDAWPAIRAGLAGVRLADIMAVTGLSKAFASEVRSGKYRPHPSLWPALAQLASKPDSQGADSAPNRPNASGGDRVGRTRGVKRP